MAEKRAFGNTKDRGYYSYKEIAFELGVSEDVVRQIEWRAIKKIQTYLVKNPKIRQEVYSTFLDVANTRAGLDTAVRMSFF